MTKQRFSLLGDNSLDQGRAFFTKKEPACSSTTRTLPLLGAGCSNRWALEGHLFTLSVSTDVISGTILKNRPKNERTMRNSFHLSQGGQNSLDVKLQSALNALNIGNTTTTCNTLTSFIAEAKAQSGKMLTQDQAIQLIKAATQIEAILGC